MITLEKLEQQAEQRLEAEIEEQRRQHAALVARQAEILEKEIKPIILAMLCQQYGLDPEDLNQALMVEGREWGPKDPAERSRSEAEEWPWQTRVTIETAQRLPVQRSYKWGRSPEAPEGMRYLPSGNCWLVYPDADSYPRENEHLGEALIMARKLYAKRQEWEAKQRMKQERNEGKKAHEARVEERMIDFLTGDPVALALARVFAMIQLERDRFERELSNADTWAEELEGMLEAARDQAAQEIEALESKAEYERQRAEDLQNDVYELEDKMRKERRGW